MVDMNILAQDIMRTRIEKGFYTPPGLEVEAQREFMLGKLMLIVTEVAEAAEAVRHNDLENFKEELADTIIRILDIAATCGINITQAVKAKMEVNAGRPYKHGKKLSL